MADWTNSREWTKYASQRSATINLTAGQKYYIEVLHKEATGGDNFAVSWQGPGIAQAVVGGNFLSPFVPDGQHLQSLGDEGRCRQRYGHVVTLGHQLRQHLQRELHQRHIRDAHGRGGQRLDVRGLERRVHAAPAPARCR